MGVLCLFLVLSFSNFCALLVLQSSRWGSESWLLYFAVFLVSLDSQCSVALPHGVVGWSAQCVIVVFPDHTQLLFWLSFQWLSMTKISLKGNIN